VRTAGALEGLDGLILPGGESTSMRRLAAADGLADALRAFGSTRPVWGVCAGLILMAARVQGESAFAGLLDMTVARNAYGRQGESFVQDVLVDGLPGGVFPGIFIRAPRVVEAGPDVEVLACVHDSPVALRRGRLLGTSFHPELTGDVRMHRFFLDLCSGREALPAAS
jgi:5'-phosphate synthase pdxT subunit